MSYAKNLLHNFINNELTQVANQRREPVLAYYGPIAYETRGHLINSIDALASYHDQQSGITIMLQTNGGSAEYAEFIVESIRSKFKGEVTFIVPDVAMSAGTILCMSADHILMSYRSRLGPTDPQVWNGRNWVPALGYLDMVEEIEEKASKGRLNEADFSKLSKIDLAELKLYREARELSNHLLVKWLTDYKFKKWELHRSDQSKLGEPVTLEEKKERAKTIANLLSSNKEWHSHNRMINAEKLRRELRLEIDDLDSVKNNELKSHVYLAHELINEQIETLGLSFVIHTANYNHNDHEEH